MLGYRRAAAPVACKPRIGFSCWLSVAFSIETRKPLPREIRRIARRELKKARGAANLQEPLGERVHDIRTAMKKVRALNRLVRPAVGQPARRADDRLREIAHSVSPLRDAEVVLATFDRAVGPSRAALAGVRAQLAAHLRAEARAMKGDQASQRLRDDLAHERRKVEAWMPKANRWSAIDEGLTRGYRRARDAMEAAYRSETGDDFHAWRRAVKTHRHQLAALKEIAPARMKARVDELDRLGELLGDEHDLTVLEAAICGARTRLSDPGQVDELLQKITNRKRQLRQRARPLGKRVFAEPPAAFRDRLRRDFRAARS
jgi:CHAD domain-containing protein